MPPPAASQLRDHRLTLGAHLERCRLEQRARRVEQVLDALHRRAREHPHPVPSGLRRAIVEYGGELNAVRERLAVL